MEFRLSEADSLLMHLHSFNSDAHYYNIPKEISQSVALFEYRKSTQKPELSERYE